MILGIYAAGLAIGWYVRKLWEEHTTGTKRITLQDSDFFEEP